MTAAGALRRGIIAAATAGARPRPLAAAPPLPPKARVLLIRPDHLGDVVFTGPALARLTRARPRWHVELLVGPWARPVATMLPGGAEIIAASFPFFDRLPKPAPWVPYLRLARVAGRLRQRRFDAAVVLRDDDWWSGWLARRAGIPIRVGHDHPALAGFLTHVLPAAPAHTAARNLALVSALCDDERPPDPRTDPLGLAVPAAAAAAARGVLNPPSGAG
ncbi:MAG: glycosyltransferase family 9 protein, partial [Anaerolineae bacterium]